MLKSCNFRRQLCTCVLIISILLFSVISLLLCIIAWNFDTLFQEFMRRQITFTPDSIMFENWKKPNTPTYKKLYVFNITNAEDILAYNAKPQLQEIGPFTYCLRREFSHFNFSSENPPKFLTYLTTEDHEFQPHMSIGYPEDYIVTVPDFMFFGIDQFEMMNKLVDTHSLTSHDKPFVTMSVKSYFIDRTSFIFSIGVMKTLSETTKEWKTINTGANDLEAIGRIVEINGIRNWDLWKYDEANHFKGMEGYRSTYNLQVGDKISLYVNNICRDMYMEAMRYRRSSVRSAIELLEYQLRPMDTTSDFEERKFCNNDGICPPTGVLYLDLCMGIPLFLSQPHFYNADPRLRHEVDGLKKIDDEQYMSFVAMEPTLGITMEVKFQTQIGVLIHRKNDHYQNMIGPTHLPAFWITSEVTSTDDQAASVETFLSMLHKIVMKICVGSITSVILAFINVFILVAHRCFIMDSICPPRLRRRRKLVFLHVPSSVSQMNLTSNILIRESSLDSTSDATNSDENVEQNGTLTLAKIFHHDTQYGHSRMA